MSDLELEAYLHGFVEGYSSALEFSTGEIVENLEPWHGIAKGSQ